MGLKLGATITQHRTRNSMGEHYGSQSMGIGYGAGLFWQNEEEGWGYDISLLYTSRNSVASTVQQQEIIYTLKSLELPIMLRYEIESVYFGLGAYIQYGLGKVHINGGTILPSKDYSYKDLKLYPWEVGAIAGLGTKFDSGIGFMVIENRFNIGLTNRARNPYGRTMFKSWSYDLLAGLAF